MPDAVAGAPVEREDDSIPRSRVNPALDTLMRTVPAEWRR
jgi:hypothetical protein